MNPEVQWRVIGEIPVDGATVAFRDAMQCQGRLEAYLPQQVRGPLSVTDITGLVQLE
jgi:hypothetical protein